MDADNVKCIQQLPTSRISGMVGIRKLPFINHHTCLWVCRNIIKSLRHHAFLIHIRQKYTDCLFYRISPAECTYDSFLRQRISLFLHLPADNCLLSAADRPWRRISPICISFQHRIRIQKCSRNITEKEFSICRGGRPIHEAAWFVGCIIKQLHTNILCHFSCHCCIFIRRYGPW